MSERSQFIQDYARVETRGSMMSKQKKDTSEDDLNDKVISSKKLFKYEDNFITNEERRLKELSGKVLQQRQICQKYIEINDPKDSDFNYNRVSKLSHEFVYDIIEEQLKQFNKAQDVLKVFQKKNENINFFLCDFDAIIDSQEVTEKKKSIQMQPNQQNRLSAPSEFQSYKVIALKDMYSQGMSFFLIEKTLTYDVVRECDDGIYLEVRSRESQNKIGIFKKKDFQQIIINNNAKEIKKNTLSININTANDTISQQINPSNTDQDDHSQDSSRSYRINQTSYAINNQKQQISKRLVSPTKNQKISMLSPGQISTASSKKRYQ